MQELQDGLELSLFLDQDLLERQHRIKTQLERLLVELANEFPQELLRQLHSSSKGTKISKGNELHRSPYLVLDLIRDFDQNIGINIRVLTWMGRGCFLLILLGKEIPHGAEDFLSLGFSFGLHPDKWNLEALIINKNQSDSLDEWKSKPEDFTLWIKNIPLQESMRSNFQLLSSELKKILKILS